MIEAPIPLALSLVMMALSMAKDTKTMVTRTPTNNIINPTEVRANKRIGIPVPIKKSKHQRQN